MTNKLEKEILNTYEWYHKEPINREFYDLYIILLTKDENAQDYYLQFWEDLKQYGYNMYCPR